tara:strand:- start:136 stop:435 length:300 start_codon:yes stop_codon:yes gene_type:complete
MGSEKETKKLEAEILEDDTGIFVQIDFTCSDTPTREIIYGSSEYAHARELLDRRLHERKWARSGSVTATMSYKTTVIHGEGDYKYKIVLSADISPTVLN